MNIYGKDTFHTRQWSGGATTELYIAPETASYEKRDFDIRISTATVEAETSVFTFFPQMDRLLMVVAGSMELSHDGGPMTCLKTMESHRFSGEAHTESAGQCQDFNIIIRRSAYSFDSARAVCGEPAVIGGPQQGKVFFYAVKGDYEISSDEEVKTIQAGGLAVADSFGTAFRIQPKEPGCLVCAAIKTVC